MRRSRFRIEFMAIPDDLSPREAETQVFDWPQSGGAVMRDAKVWYFGNDRYVRVLWLESVDEVAG